MELSDVQVKRARELKAIAPDQFVVRDAELLTQGDIEEWAEAMGGFDLSGDNMNLPKMRRLAFQAAYKIGWFKEAPALSDEDFLLLPPMVVSRCGDMALALYNKVTIPEVPFT